MNESEIQSRIIIPTFIYSCKQMNLYNIRSFHQIKLAQYYKAFFMITSKSNKVNLKLSWRSSPMTDMTKYSMGESSQLTKLVSDIGLVVQSNPKPKQN